MDRVLPAAVCGVDLGARREEQAHDEVMPAARRGVQGSPFLLRGDAIVRY